LREGFLGVLIPQIELRDGDRLCGEGQGAEGEKQCDSHVTVLSGMGGGDKKFGSKSGGSYFGFVLVRFVLARMTAPGGRGSLRGVGLAIGCYLWRYGQS
jgi:hypothetical protein